MNVKIEHSFSNNPWCVDDATAFLKFCCPECDYQIPDLQMFSDHAVDNHLKVGNNQKVLIWLSYPQTDEPNYHPEVELWKCSSLIEQDSKFRLLSWFGLSVWGFDNPISSFKLFPTFIVNCPFWNRKSRRTCNHKTRAFGIWIWK